MWKADQYSKPKTWSFIWLSRVLSKKKTTDWRIQFRATITGGGVIKEGLWENEKPGRVLLIDGEMDMEDLKERQELSIKATDADQESVYKNLQIISRQDQMMNFGFLNLGNKESQK